MKFMRYSVMAAFAAIGMSSFGVGYITWQSSGVYGSAESPIDGGAVLVPKEVSEAATGKSSLTAYVKPGEKLIFVGTSDPSGSKPHNKAYFFAADATVTVMSGQVEFQCPVTLSGDINFVGPGDNELIHSGRYLYDTAEKAETLFTGMTLADFEPRTTEFDNTRVLAYGTGKAYAVKHGTDGSGNDTLVFQLQEFDGTYTKAAEVTLFQSGSDVKGYVSGGWYAKGKVLGLDFREIPGTYAYVIRTPDITKADTYGIGIDNFKMVRNGNTAAIITRAVTGPGTIRVGSGAYVLADGAGALTPRVSTTATFTNGIDVAYGGTFVVRNHDIKLSGAITGLGTVRCDVQRRNELRFAGQAGWNNDLRTLAAPGRKFADLTNATCTLRYRYKGSDPTAFDTTGSTVGLATMRSTKIEKYDYYESDTKHYYVNFIQFQKKIGDTLVGFLVLAADIDDGMYVYDSRWGYRVGDEYQEGVYDFDYNENRKNYDAATGLSSNFSLSPEGTYNVQDFKFSFKDPATAFSRTVTLSGNSWTGKSGSAGRLEVASDGEDAMMVKTTAQYAAPQYGDIMIYSNCTFSAGATMQNLQVYTFRGGHLKTANNGALSSSGCVINILGGDYEVTAGQELPRSLYLTDGSRVYGTGKLILGDYNSSYYTYASGEGAVATIENKIEFSGRGNNVACVQHIGAYSGACLKLTGLLCGTTAADKQNYSLMTDAATGGTLLITRDDNTLAKPLTVNSGTLKLAGDNSLTNAVALTNNTTLAVAAGTVNTLASLTVNGDASSVSIVIEAGARLTVPALTLPAVASINITSAMNDNTGVGLCLPVGTSLANIRCNGKKVYQDSNGWLHASGTMILLR